MSLQPGSLVSSLDVVCLYPNMDQDECISCVRKFLIENHSPLEQSFTKSLIELLTFVLKFNNFQFDGKDYLQMGDTAMGTKVAPSLATVYPTNILACCKVGLPAADGGIVAAVAAT